MTADAITRTEINDRVTECSRCNHQLAACTRRRDSHTGYKRLARWTPSRRPTGHGRCRWRYAEHLPLHRRRFPKANTTPMAASQKLQRPSLVQIEVGQFSISMNIGGSICWSYRLDICCPTDKPSRNFVNQCSPDCAVRCRYTQSALVI